MFMASSYSIVFSPSLLIKTNEGRMQQKVFHALICRYYELERFGQVKEGEYL
jgi:hypothetical protein